MHKIIFILSLIIVMIPAMTTYATRGVVVYYNYSSGKIIIETSLGYTCGEVYSYSGLLDTGDTIAGNLESYGVHEVYNLTHDSTFQIYIDEYWLNRNRALEWLGR